VRRYQFFYLIFFLTLAVILAFSLLVDFSPLVSCDKWQYTTASTTEKNYTHPIELVVQPWRGQHQVYGTFLIPYGYRNDGFFTITLPGQETHCGQLINIGDVSIPERDTRPQNHIIRGYLNTRTALWLFVQGKGGELKQPNNWKLGYFKNRKKRNMIKIHQQDQQNGV
jgi:hypothetical protein